MFSRVGAVFCAIAITAAPVAIVAMTTTGAVAGGTYYANCDALHRDYRHGVAKSAAAATKQVRDGYGRPAYGRVARAVYATNHSRLDRDDDGTACEA